MGGGRHNSMGGRTTFVTVGTTKFDALIKAMDNIDIAQELATKGYTNLVMQIGEGAYTPHKIVPRGALRSVLPNGLAVEMFKYAPDLGAHMRDADLIISHAGSGSLFEALRLKKKVIAVPNALLMANHQAELASHLEALQHCKMATTESLLEVLQDLDGKQTVAYKVGDPRGIVDQIDKHMGFA